MSEWKDDILQNHASLITKGTTPTSLGKSFQENGINFIKAESITDSGTFIHSAFAFIDTETHKILQRSQLQCGDILFSIAGVLGRVAIVNCDIIPANTNQAIALIRLPDTSNLEKDFLKYYLNSSFIKEQIKRINVQAAQANFSLGDINRLILHFPTSLHEQRKIARILSTVDAVIEKSEAAIAKYKAIKFGMMRDLFTRGIDLKTGKLRPRYEDAPELYKQSELGWVPKEWEVVRINQVSTLVTNGFVGVATPYYESSDNGITYLYGTNIRKDEITFDDIRYVSRQFHNKQVKSQLKTGDMLTVQSGHIGTSAIVPENLGDANCHALIITRFVLSEIFPWFISYYLNSDIGMHGLEKLFIGSTIKHINTSELAKHLILKPDIEEQKEISKRIDAIELLLRNESGNFKKIQNLKQALMSDLLTGKVRVKYEEEKAEAQ